MSLGMTEMKGDMRVDMMYGTMPGEMDNHMGYGGGSAVTGGEQYYNQQWCAADYNYYQVDRQIDIWMDRQIDKQKRWNKKKIKPKDW